MRSERGLGGAERLRLRIDTHIEDLKEAACGGLPERDYLLVCGRIGGLRLALEEFDEVQRSEAGEEEEADVVRS